LTAFTTWPSAADICSKRSTTSQASPTIAARRKAAVKRKRVRTVAIAQHPGIDLFVSWNIRGAGPLVNRLRPGGLADELLDDLRRQFGERSPTAWSVSIQCDSPLSVPAEWYDQETCLGDFLREVREFELHEHLPLDLRQFLPEDVRDDPLAAIAQIESDEDRGALLCRTAKLGVDLLTLPLEEGDIPGDA
jgi:hypothetical protein